MVQILRALLTLVWAAAVVGQAPARVYGSVIPPGSPKALQIAAAVNELKNGWNEVHNTAQSNLETREVNSGGTATPSGAGTITTTGASTWGVTPDPGGALTQPNSGHLVGTGGGKYVGTNTQNEIQIPEEDFGSDGRYCPEALGAAGSEAKTIALASTIGHETAHTRQDADYPPPSKEERRRIVKEHIEIYQDQKDFIELEILAHLLSSEETSTELESWQRHICDLQGQAEDRLRNIK